MSDLFFSECRRYRRVALIAFLAHLALLLYLSRHNVLLAAPLHIQILALLIYALPASASRCTSSPAIAGPAAGCGCCTGRCRAAPSSVR